MPLTDRQKQIKKFLKQHRAWLAKNLPGCAYGLSTTRRDRRPCIALRLTEDTPAIRAKIEEFRTMARAAGFEVELRDVGRIRPR